MSSTQVILLERVDKLGAMGDVVNVKPGFARNYLLPQKKALRASKANMAYFEAQKKTIQAESDKLKKEAEKLAKKVEGLKVPLIRQASESGQLYGSVTARDIAEQIKETSGEAIARSAILVNQNYKQVGLFPVGVQLHPELIVEVTVNIARSPEEADIQAKTGKALISEADAVEEAAPEEMEADETQLEGVLEEGALEAEKEKQAAAEEEAQAKAEEAARKAEAQAEKEAAEAQAAAAAAEEAEAQEAETAEEAQDENEEEKS